MLDRKRMVAEGPVEGGQKLGCPVQPACIAIQVPGDGGMWKTVDEESVEELPRPEDFEPSTIQVSLAVPETDVRAGFRVVIDPEDEQFEVYEGNNTVVVGSR